MHCFPITVLGFFTPDIRWLFYISLICCMCIDDSTTIHVLHSGKGKDRGIGRGEEKGGYNVVVTGMCVCIPCILVLLLPTYTCNSTELVSV